MDHTGICSIGNSISPLCHSSCIDHPEIFEGVPSEGEGLRLVKKSLAYLIKTGHIWLVPKLAGQSGFKYMGYFLGKRYKKLPKKVILFCTMNREYWKNE